MGLPDEELSRLRRDIDGCDGQIVELLARRFELVRRVGRHKAANGLPVLDEARESALIADRKQRAAAKPNYRVEGIFRLIMAQSRQLQARSSARTGISARRLDAATSAAKSWTVTIGAGLIENIPHLFDFTPYSAIAFITDDTVARLYSDRVMRALRATEKNVCQFSIPPGEPSKSLDHARRGYRYLMENSFDRNSLLCLLGGGVVGDLGGYIAATYLRGIDYIQIPTTLLAQVDAGIGGKVGVNFAGKKNIIGCFYQPRAIISDVDLLKSLPVTEMRNGLAEIIKYGAAMDVALFEKLYSANGTLEAAGLIDVIERCVRLKLEIIEADETERTGQRAILNFGHSVGHALEAVQGLEGRHGEAVAIGMAAAARLSARLGMLKPEEVSRIERLIGNYGLPVSCPGVKPELLLRAMRYDKKMRRGELRWVLLEGIGHGVVNCTVKEDIVLDTLGEVCQ